MPFGVADTEYVDVPLNVDEQYLDAMAAAAGVSFAEMIREIDDRMRAFNANVSPLVASLIYTTQEAFIDQQGVSPFDVQPAGEYGMARPQISEEIPGWMLPLRKWDAAIGWTEDGLRQRRRPSLMRNLDNLLLGFRVRLQKEVIRRLFSDAEVQVEKRSSSTSPGFAGSGTGLNEYVTPYPDGTALPANYTHYQRAASADLAAALDSALALFHRQQIPPPYDFYGPEAMVNAVKALTGDLGFVGVGSAMIRQNPDIAEALVDPTTYIGVIRNEIRVRNPIQDFTDPNFAVVKTYGALDPRNPLAIRYPDEAGLPDNGQSAYVRSRELYPLSNAEVVSWWGVGVSNRVGAVLTRIDAAGNYVAPVIS